MLKEDIIYALFDNWCNDNEREPEVTEAMEKTVKNPNTDTIFELSAITEANAFKAGVRACLDMIHCLFIEDKERNLDNRMKKKIELTTCEGKKPLASEIIADQGKEIEELRAKLVDVIDKLEDCLCSVMDSADKACYILYSSDRRLLDTGAPTQTDLEVFYGQKEKMLTEHWIAEDYLERIKEETGKLDEVQRELNKLQEGGTYEEM